MKGILRRLMLDLSRRIPPSIKDRLLGIPIVSSTRSWVYQNSQMELFTVPGLPFELKLYLDPEYPGERLFITRQHEPYVVDYLLRTVKPGWVSFDVGAFIGFYSVLLGKLCGSEGHVVAFEPLSVFEERILMACRANGLENVRVEPLALADNVGRTEFWVHEVRGKGLGTSSSLSRIPHTGYMIHVDTTTIDHYIHSNNIHRIDLIKIDVEGAELQVLRGAEETLKNFGPVIIAEFNDDEQRAQAEDLLSRWGYKCEQLGRTSYGVHIVATKGS